MPNGMSAQQADEAIRDMRRRQEQSLASRTEPLGVRIGLGLVAMAWAACYDVFDHPGTAPLMLFALAFCGYAIAARTPRGAAALRFRSAGLRGLPPAYVAGVLVLYAALFALGGLGVRACAGFLDARVPYWHLLGMAALIAAVTATAPLDRRMRTWLMAHARKQGTR